MEEVPEPVWALLGVVVGGLIGLTSSYFITTWRRRIEVRDRLRTLYAEYLAISSGILSEWFMIYHNPGSERATWLFEQGAIREQQIRRELLILDTDRRRSSDVVESLHASMETALEEMTKRGGDPEFIKAHRQCKACIARLQQRLEAELGADPGFFTLWRRPDFARVRGAPASAPAPPPAPPS